MKTARAARRPAKTAAPLDGLAPESRPALEVLNQAGKRAPWDPSGRAQEDAERLLALAGHGGAHASGR